MNMQEQMTALTAKVEELTNNFYVEKIPKNEFVTVWNLSDPDNKVEMVATGECDEYYHIEVLPLSMLNDNVEIPDDFDNAEHFDRFFITNPE